VLRSVTRKDEGFALVEALVAATILTIALGTMAELFIMTARANRSARQVTQAAMAARDKMEELALSAWGSAPSLSSVDSLDRNTTGFWDLLDERGRSLSEREARSGAARFLRRWSVQPLATNPTDAVVLQVLVKGWSDRLPGEARLVTVRARKGAP
jgi:type II secretory pathway pseudopilin PulG